MNERAEQLKRIQRRGIVGILAGTTVVFGGLASYYAVESIHQPAPGHVLIGESHQADMVSTEKIAQEKTRAEAFGTIALVGLVGTGVCTTLAVRRPEEYSL